MDIEGIAGRLREAREAAGVTQMVVAVAAQSNPYTICNVERGRTKARLDLIDAYQRVTGAELEWLLTGKGRKWSK